MPIRQVSSEVSRKPWPCSPVEVPWLVSCRIQRENITIRSDSPPLAIWVQHV